MVEWANSPDTNQESDRAEEPSQCSFVPSSLSYRKAVLLGRELGLSCHGGNSLDFTRMS